MRRVRYRFGEFTMDTDSFELFREGEPVGVEPQVFEVIALLVEHRDRLVTKNELLDEVWGDRFVSESALTSRIKAARRAVDDDGTTHREMGDAAELFAEHLVTPCLRRCQPLEGLHAGNEVHLHPELGHREVVQNVLRAQQPADGLVDRDVGFRVPNDNVVLAVRVIRVDTERVVR